MNPFKSYKKIIHIGIVIVVFFLIAFNAYAESMPLAKEGFLDLSNFDFESNKLTELNGQWHFYWHEFITPRTPLKESYFNVPGIWDGLEYGASTLTEDGHASLRLTVQTDGKKRLYGMRINYINTAFKLFINGEEMIVNGHPASSKAESVPYFIPHTLYFESDKPTFEVIIHTSNYEYRDGDIRSIQFGSAKAIQSSHVRSLLQDAFLVGSLIIMGVYHIVLYYFSKNDRAPFYLGLLFMILAMRSSMINERLALILSNQHISWSLMEKLAYIGFYLAVPVFYTYFSYVLKPHYSDKILKTTWGIGLYITLLTLFTTNKIYDIQLNPFLVFLCLLFIYAGYVLFKARRTHPVEVKVIIFAHLLLIVVVINDILYDRGWIDSQFFTGFAILFFMYIQSLLLARNYSESFKKTEQLAVQNHLMYQEIHELNIGLEEKIQSRTQTISNINAALSKNQKSIKNLLDNAGQGFLSFGTDLLIRDNYSAECETLFGYDIANNDFSTLLPEDANPKLIKEIISKSFNTLDSYKSNVYLTLLPTQLLIRNHVVEVQFKRIDTVDEKMIMVILTDITDKMILEKNLLEEQRVLNMIVQIVSNHIPFSTLLLDYKTFCTQDVPLMLSTFKHEDTFHRFYRTIHNFKGIFTQYGMLETASRFEALEKELSSLSLDNHHEMDTFIHHHMQSNMIDFIQHDMDIINQSIGTFLTDKNRFEIAEEDINTVLATLDQAQTPEDLIHVQYLIKKMKYRNIKDLLRGYIDYTHRLADSLGKQVSPLELVGEDLWVDPDKIAPFTKSLVHVFRNMLDHGIELPEIRDQLNKPSLGKITCTYKLDKAHLLISISDDGYGIQTEKLIENAISLKIITPEDAVSMTLEDLHMLINLNQLTTKDEVSSLSGRGYGMAAVKEALDALGGTMRILSQPKKGTTFTFAIPLEE